MRTHPIFFLLALAWGLPACQAPSQEAEAVEALPAEAKIGPNSPILRQAIAPPVPTDTLNIGKLRFDETAFAFGTVDEGAVVEHEFAFQNIGSRPLSILDAKGSCGCTVADYPHQPIAPGERGNIRVRFNTEGKAGQQSKPVTLSTNGYPQSYQLKVYGAVREKAAQ